MRKKAKPERVRIALSISIYQVGHAKKAERHPRQPQKYYDHARE
jgi:hypothetical protein